MIGARCAFCTAQPLHDRGQTAALASLPRLLIHEGSNLLKPLIHEGLHMLFQGCYCHSMLLGDVDL